jgi:Mlc titration factor MtfA (ptsG expression regulator)
MESQQIMELLLAMQEDRKTDTERMIARMDAIQEKADASEEMTARMDAKMGSMKAELKSAIKDLKFDREETMACQEMMEASLEEKPASVDMRPEVAH